MSRLIDLLADYLAYARDDSDFLPSTVGTYAPNLRAFLRWLEGDQACQEPPALCDFDLPTLKQYLKHLKTKPSKNQIGLRPRSIRSQFAALRSFGDWLVERGLLAANPAQAVALPAKDAVQRALVSDDEVRALLAACARLSPVHRRLQGTAVLSVLCCAAVRRAELLSILVSDVHFGSKAEDNYIVVQHGKGDKRRLAYIPRETIGALQEWIAHRTTMGCQHNYLFVCDTRRRMGDSMLDSLIDQVKAAADMPDNSRVVPHALRHGWASHAHASGMPLLDIQEQLGHSDIKTTAAYLHSNPRQRARSVEMASWTAPVPSLPEMPPVPAPTSPPALPALPAPPVAPDPPTPLPAATPPPLPKQNKEHKIRTITRSR